MSEQSSRPESYKGTWELGRKQWYIFSGAMSGWILDSFDLSIMFLLIVPLSELFFPKGDSTLALVETLSVYFVALVFRPLGGLLFGRFGDIVGRKMAMIATLTGLGIVVFLTGLLPTYESAGIIAPILLIIMRVLTGTFAGGEYGNSSVIFMESVPSKVRGRFSGLIQGGYPIGFSLAAFAFLIVKFSYSDASFLTIGWRMLFFIGIIPAFLGLLIRLGMPESSMWANMYERGNLDESPIRTVFTKSKYLHAFGTGMLITSGISWLYNLTVGFYSTTLVNYVGIAFPYYTYIVIAAILSSLVGYLASGAMSDSIGRKNTVIAFALVGMIAAFPANYFLYANVFGLLPIGILACVLALSTTGIYGVIPAFLSEKFPTRIRGTGVGASFNSGFIVGSWSSAIVLILSAPTDIWLIASIGIVAGEVMLLASVLMSKETVGKDLGSIK